MRKSLVVLTILTVLASACTEQSKPDPQPRPIVTASVQSSVATVRRAVNTIPPTASTVSTGIAAATTTTTSACSSEDTATTAASAFVTALINGNSQSAVSDWELWRQVVADGAIIQTTPLSEAAGRASVAISVAFEKPDDLAIVDPIGLRIELAQSAGCWRVESVGYL